MKATIKLDGTLYIQAETELEGFALNMWSKVQVAPADVPHENLVDGSKMVFCSDPKKAYEVE
jgi:hypothetical protein